MQPSRAPQFINTPQKIRGQQFSQESLPPILRDITAGQPIAIKVLLIVTVVFLCIISGIIAGFLGSYSFFNIFSQTDEYWIEYLWLIWVIIGWMIATIRKGIAKGLLVAIQIFLIVLVVTALLAELNLLPPSQEGISPTIDHSLANLGHISIGMTFAIISLLTSSFALALIYVLFDNYQSLARITCAFIIIFTAIIAANSAYSSGFIGTIQIARRTSITAISIFGGTLLGIGIVFASLIATNFSNKYRTHFKFLRDWAIAVGSWGGTSFYNLDLSRVDFTGSKLANTNFRARKLYRTCLQEVSGLERARVDSRCLDLDNPKVQKLLTKGCGVEKNFSRLNLQGAYLRDAQLIELNLTETNLTGADLQGANLQKSILVRAQVTGVDFTGANLTGICIEDWTVNSQTCFAGVRCGYIYRKLDKNGKHTERYPVGRNFEEGEFESLFQEVGNVVELIFKEGLDWRALSFSIRKLQLEDDGLGLELKGVEKRGELWVVKVTHKEGISRQTVEQRVNTIYEDIKGLLAIKEQQINKLLDITANQAEALKGYSKQPFGNSFFIFGSTITNLAGSGKIDYDEAASKIRSIVANGGNPETATSLAENLLNQLQNHSIATSPEQQAELIQQVMIAEAKKDPIFKQFLVQQGQKMADLMPENAITIAICNAIAQLS